MKIYKIKEEKKKLQIKNIHKMIICNKLTETERNKELFEFWRYS